MGSHQLVITDVANPVDNDDPGKLSFVWGTETWESWTGTSCSVIPVGDWGAKWGYVYSPSHIFRLRRGGSDAEGREDYECLLMMRGIGILRILVVRSNAITDHRE